MNLTGFAEACFDQNSIAELEQALIDGPDITDCKTWGLTREQWTSAVELALKEKKKNNEITLQVSEREFHMILAALRLWQEIVNANHQEIDDWIGEISTNQGALEDLADQEIEELCDRINTKDNIVVPRHKPDASECDCYRCTGKTPRGKE